MPEVAAAADRRAHAREVAVELGDVRVGAPPRREAGDRDLDRLPQLEHLVDRELARGDRVREEPVERRGAELADHGAPAVRDLDQPGGDELPTPLAHDPARDAEAARELDLPGERVAGAEAVRDDLGTDVRRDALGEGWGGCRHARA